MSGKPQAQPITEAEQLQRRNHELSILNATAQALNRSIDLDQALHAALAQVAELLGLQTGWVWLLEEDTRRPYLAAAQNLPPALADKPQRMEGRCYCLDTYKAGDLAGAANVNVLTCSRLWGLVDGTDGLRYHASIPLYAHGKQLGVMNLASADWRELSPEDLRLLYTAGDLLSIAIERARLFDRRAEFGAAEERNRLAREIHDTLAQGLAGIALQLETADLLLESSMGAEQARQTVRHALELARTNLEEARRSVLDLRAAPLEGLSLPEALSSLAKQVTERDGLPVRCIVRGTKLSLPVRVEAGLFRIAQEALANVVQHSQANKAILRLTITPRQVSLRIEDDGRGFDPSAIPADRFGLVGLNERARLLGGNLQVRSATGQGTQIVVTVPRT